MAIGNDQLPTDLKAICDDEIKIFGDGASITERNTLPSTTDIPIENPNYWLKIPDVICVYVDMRNSTGLSASSHPNTTASSVRLFTSTAVKIFHQLDCPYIDIKGDGAFGLFNADSTHRALAAGVSIRTFAIEEFIPRVKAKTDVDVGIRTGIDMKTILVRKIGLKFSGDRTDRQNEVWAGKSVNMASKLGALTNNNELLVSDRFHAKLTDGKALKSCGCPSGQAADLWKPVDLSGDDRFDFDLAYKLESSWCKTHGREYCSHLITAD